LKQPKTYKAAAAKQGKDNDKRKEGAKWLERVKAAGKLEKGWMDDAAKAVNAYTNSNKNQMERADVLGSRYDFNILYANVETIVPAVINSPPVPDIRRRFNDPDPAARIVSDLMERAIRVQIDDSKMQIELEGTAQDAFLAGRGVIRIRFKSNIVGTKDEPSDEELKEADDAARGTVGSSGQDDEYLPDGYDTEAGPESEPVLADQGVRGIGDNGGPALERIEDECIPVEAVAWHDYRHGPATRWADRPWDAFRFCIAREDESTSFDTKLIDSQLDEAEKNAWRTSDNDLTGWEIWCKKDRKVKFIDDAGIILKEIDDPLGLPDFFCIPTPMQPIELVGNLRPYNPFNIYSKLADELDTITKRINILVEAMQVKGWYPGDVKDILNIMSLADNEFAPVAGAELWAQNGGIDGIVAFWPIEKFAACLKELYLAREQTKQSIYEITGISDIVRGASQASETATAQNIKSQWGSLRIQKMQRMLERCARDLFIMMSEIIPTKFSRETLEKMTGIPLIPQQGMDPEQLKRIQAVNALLDQRISTYYRVDVESDSTVRADLTRQKQEAGEFLTASGSYFEAVMPMVQTGEMSPEVAIELYSSNARLFNLGKSTEDVLEKWATETRAKAQQPQPEKPDPEAIKAQTEQAKIQAEGQKAQTEAQTAQADNQVKLITAQTQAQEKAHALQQKDAAETEKQRQAAATFDQNLRIALMTAETTDKAKLAEIAIKEMDKAIKEIDLEMKRTELQKLLNAPTDTGEAAKPPSESISFKDLPPEGQAQMAAQAGIDLSPQQMADHAAEQAKQEAKKAAVKAKKPNVQG
jgi:hypothetical protein